MMTMYMERSTLKSLVSCWVVLVSLCLLSGCLKTRAQLRDDPDDSKGVPTQPAQDVRPQGQYVIDEVKDEITRIEGRLEDVERTQKESASQKNGGADKDELKKLEDKITQLEQGQADLLEKLKTLQEAPPVAADPNEIFNEAKSQFGAEQYEKAIEGFSAYLKNSKNTKHIEEATFLKGESYFKLKQYKRSIVEYSKFPEKFTRSNRMPEALYKIGLCFDALGMKDDAKGFYQELVEKYPKSSEAKKARKKVK